MPSLVDSFLGSVGYGGVLEGAELNLNLYMDHDDFKTSSITIAQIE